VLWNKIYREHQKVVNKDSIRVLDKEEMRGGFTKGSGGDPAEGGIIKSGKKGRREQSWKMP